VQDWRLIVRRHFYGDRGGPWIELSLVQLIRTIAAAILVCGVWAPSIRALEEFEYGFRIVDNSSGGAVMDGYISQELWAETEIDFMSAQILLELDAGSVFQDQFAGSEFTLGAPPESLVELRPSLAFDTHVSIDGGMPQIVAGGA
jgi:hypothetical protein